VRTLALLLFVISPILAHGHARLLLNGNLPPRSNSTGEKIGPCGPAAKKAPKVFQAGQQVLVQWEETINHPGRFEISFSPANDQNFTLLGVMQDAQNGAIMNGNYHQYSMLVTLPNVNCAQCTLQLIQVMTENPAAPSNYYSCSDISLVNADPGLPTTTTTLPPAGGGSPTPTPTTVPDPTAGPDGC
jgi:hypothetical protein